MRRLTISRHLANDLDVHDLTIHVEHLIELFFIGSGRQITHKDGATVSYGASPWGMHDLAGA